MRTQFLTAWVKTNPVTTVLVLLIVAVVLWYFSGSVSQMWAGHQVNKADQKLEKQIDTNQKSADSSETNANSHSDARQAAEGRAAKAWEDRQQARENSSRTVDPLRKARERYEKTRRRRTADAPALSDDELCAELTRRSIACR